MLSLFTPSCPGRDFELLVVEEPESYSAAFGSPLKQVDLIVVATVVVLRGVSVDAVKAASFAVVGLDQFPQNVTSKILHPAAEPKASAHFQLPFLSRSTIWLAAPGTMKLTAM